MLKIRSSERATTLSSPWHHRRFIGPANMRARKRSRVSMQQVEDEVIVRMTMRGKEIWAGRLKRISGLANDNLPQAVIKFEVRVRRRHRRRHRRHPRELMIEVRKDESDEDEV